MEMLANAPSSHQPNFCNPARCRRPWPRRRSGACRSMQQQDRAIRAGGAPVRGKSERRADGAAIDWRTARCPTDAGLDQTRRAKGESDVRRDLGTRQAARCARKSRGMHAGTRRRQANVQSVMIDECGGPEGRIISAASRRRRRAENPIATGISRISACPRQVPRAWRWPELFCYGFQRLALVGETWTRQARDMATWTTSRRRSPTAPFTRRSRPAASSKAHPRGERITGGPTFRLSW